MPKPVFSDLFTFESGRRNRRSFLLLVLLCFFTATAIVAWIFIPSLLAAKALAVSGPPALPAEVSIAQIVFGFSLGLIRIAVLFAVIVALWAAAAQRFHDLGYSGWAILWLLAPFIQFYYLYLLFFRQGSVGENRFGTDPLSAR